MVPIIDDLERIFALCAKYQIDVLHYGELKVVRGAHVPVTIAPAPTGREEVEELLDWAAAEEGGA